jgi:hypothetical protein
MRVRLANLDDIDAVHDLLERTWGATYEPLLGRNRVDALHAKWHAPDALARHIGVQGTSFLVGDDEASGIIAHAFGSTQQPPVSGSALCPRRLFSGGGSGRGC